MTIKLASSLFVSGITMGVVYAIVAMGLILLIRAVGVLNFAQGDILLAGAYITCLFTVDYKMPIWLMLPLAIICFAVLGFCFMLGTYWPLRNASYPVAPVIATMGASLVISEGSVLLFGSWPRVMPNLLRTAAGKPLFVEIANIKIQAQYFLIIAVACIIMFAVHALFDKLYFGRMMEAAAQDSWAAKLIGISPFLTTAATYILVVILVCTGGYLVAPIYTVTPSMSSIQLRAFAGTVIGGFGSVKGAIIGCLIVGLAEAFATVKFSAYKDAVVFIVLILFLVLRPNGLIRSTVGDKA